MERGNREAYWHAQSTQQGRGTDLSLMRVGTVNRKRQKSWCEGRLCDHLLGRTARPQPVPGDKVQGRLTEQTEVHE